MVEKTKIYLAGPLGFSEAGRQFVRAVLLPELQRLQCEVIDPFALPDQAWIDAIIAMPTGDARIAEWRKFNTHTGEANRNAIDRSNALIAVLDGVDVDSGTAAEIGYAYARGKLIIGYRGDFRLSSDNEGGIVNLQVEYFIRASGGDIVRSTSALAGTLVSQLPKAK